MTRHQASGRWRLGLLLAFLTAALWGTLPVALKLALGGLDPLTLTWFRFLFAAVGLGLWLAWRGQFGAFRGLGRAQWGLLGLAAAMLIGNYVFYLYGLHHTTPGNAQLLIQLAPILMAIGAIAVFGERFRGGQWFGLALLATGLLLFFRDQLGQLASPDYVFGTLLIGVAAVVWAIYALAQKQLLMRLSSAAILLFIYVVASIVLLPFAQPARLAALDGAQWLALIYCALNTLGAYGAFAEALAHWEASRVSLVLAITPLLTLGFVELASRVWPELLAPERIGAIGLFGALLVVSGSALTSLLGQNKRR